MAIEQTNATNGAARPRRDAIRPAPSAVCEVCGQTSDSAFELTKHGHTHAFDSFECAVHALSCDRIARPPATEPVRGDVCGHQGRATRA
jgi:hypothetical protein